MIEDAILRFNEAALELQRTEFHTAKSPEEWKRLNKSLQPRDYSKLLAVVTPLVAALNLLNPPQGSGVALQLTPDALAVLRKFSHYAAIVAVRRQTPELILSALTALAILGETDDPRDLLFYLATIYYCATKLGLETAKVFEEGAALSPPGTFCDWMRGFPLRPPNARDLKSFRLHEVTTPEGFDIVQS